MEVGLDSPSIKSMFITLNQFSITSGDIFSKTLESFGLYVEAKLEKNLIYQPVYLQDFL